MKKIIVFLLAAALLVTCPGAFAEETAEESRGNGLQIRDISKSVYSGNQMTTSIIMEPFCEGVFDEESAEQAILKVYDRLGADENTQLMLDDVVMTNSLTYYFFRQILGDLFVEGTSVKLIVDENGTAIGVVGSLESGIAYEPWTGEEITAEQAEQAVATKPGTMRLNVKKGMTHPAIVGLDDGHKLVWVVYTDNPYDDLDVAYLAHYVDERGEVIGSVPTATVYSSDVKNNSITGMAFMGMEPDVWSGEVTLFDGSTRSLTVPIMKDGEGNEYLGDPGRKILCVDYLSWEKDYELNIRQSQNGRFDDGELLIYESFIRVWDFYNEIGWEGADGKGTPILLKMDLVDDEGKPVHNAYYGGIERGFQSFAFNRDERDGETLDIICHEFTHCVSSTLTVDSPYLNDTGAINEAISDTMGNLMEEMLGASDDPDWLIGEAAKNPDQILRCMSNPHLYDQPEFVWDKDYWPAVQVDTEGTDHGGVHQNSSLLNLIAWRLHEAGMKPEDEFYYMMNVIMTMTGTINYPQLAVLLPWCLKQVKMDEYMDVLEKAIAETGIADIHPKRIPEGCALVNAEIPGDPPCVSGDLRMEFIDEDGKMDPEDRITWPDERLKEIWKVLPEGKYIVTLQDMDSGRKWILSHNGWTDYDDSYMLNTPDNMYFIFEEGTCWMLPLKGLTDAEAGQNP